jgi:hypothetical protein
MHANRDVGRAQEKLHRAREAMRQALDSVRHFSVELRTTMRPDELEQTLTGYVAANAESNVLTSVKVTGDTAMLSGEVCEEVSNLCHVAGGDPQRAGALRHHPAGGNRRNQ